jgi:hypothetical protein
MSVNTYLPPSPVEPQFLVISNITRGYPTLVTTSTENEYIAGQKVYFSVPITYAPFTRNNSSSTSYVYPVYGMSEINGMTGTILQISGSDIYVDIDSTNFSEWQNPNTTTDVDIAIQKKQVQPATLSPAGSSNIYNTTTSSFHSVGNEGN